jgi:peptidoglycan/LPS O-acetylase OafA/YrhL
MRQEQTPNKDIAAIDVIKFIMAFAVIAIHSRVSGLYGGNVWPTAIGYIISLAVPFFFIVSGLLLSYKIDAQNFTIKETQKYIRRRSFVLFRIFICWLIIYLPIAIYSYSKDGTPFLTAVVGYLYKAVMSGHSLWACQLWFVYSMIWVLLLYSFIRLSNRSLIALALLFIIISMVNIAFQKYGVACFRSVYILTHSTLGGAIPNYGIYSS